MTIQLALSIALLLTQDVNPESRARPGMVQPKLLHKEEPRMPALAAKAGLPGIVALEASIDDKGSVADVKVLTGIRLFSDPAVAAVKRWRYRPLTVDGKASGFILSIDLRLAMTRTKAAKIRATVIATGSKKSGPLW